MGFSSSNVSNNILKRAFDEDVTVTPMKLQKILYFVASEYAKETGKPLFDEPFRAWQYGPVLRSVYDEFRTYGGSPIRKFAKDAEGKAYRVSEKSNPALKNAIDRVWEKTATRSAVDLSRITHNKGSAWSKTYTSRLSDYIEDDLIRDDTTYERDLRLSPKAER
ncbi:MULTISPECIES: Panacea domain-containing protein [unclassified Curtobacterium]|uniref:Panacea domain-containing protein n=1 Tax=unclassified Curtobacterium TaxID=257496 RepID=UPI0009F167CB|nr:MULTISPECIES: type II toxin-antitoxin system antitoxin SocA domain-containing protein [unclassified Curtobacterium]